MASFQDIVLVELSKWENPNKPGTGYALEVVHSVQDGKSKGVGVRKVYFKDGGAKKILKPLQGKDLNTVWKEKARIKELMDNPPPIPPPPEPEPLAGGSLGGGEGLGGGSLGGGSLERSDDF